MSCPMLRSAGLPCGLSTFFRLMRSLAPTQSRMLYRIYLADRYESGAKSLPGTGWFGYEPSSSSAR